MQARSATFWREVLLVVVAALLQVGGPLLVAATADDVIQPPIAGLALLAVGVAAIPLRLFHPAAALVVALLATNLYVSLGYAEGPVFIGLLVTFGAAVLAGHRRLALVSVVVGFVGFSWLGPVLDREPEPTVASLVGLAAWLALLYTGCELLRLRRDRARDAARSLADTRERQVVNERLTIARELHDVVAHNMSVIHVQAGVALHVDTDLPEHTREALTTIKAASKTALVELRAILGVLRHADEGDAAPRAPSPGLGRLDELVASARAAGVEITERIDVDPASLTLAVDRAAYRILQEALTNVARHADPPIANVDVERVDDMLVVSVTDVGTGRRHNDPLPGGGNGLPGMRERAAAVGGTLEAGPRPSIGFAVEARLPIGSAA